MKPPSRDLNARDLNARDLNARDLNSSDLLNVHDLNLRNVNARDPNVEYLNARDVNTPYPNSRDLNANLNDNSLYHHQFGPSHHAAHPHHHYPVVSGSSRAETTPAASRVARQTARYAGSQDETAGDRAAGLAMENRKRCPHCDIVLLRKNLARHVRDQHQPIQQPRQVPR